MKQAPATTDDFLIEALIDPGQVQHWSAEALETIAAIAEARLQDDLAVPATFRRIWAASACLLVKDLTADMRAGRRFSHAALDDLLRTLDALGYEKTRDDLLAWLKDQARKSPPKSRHNRAVCTTASH